ncbi:MAG TPA: chloride channel protein [Bacteroidota bacterium]|nr:chloride channel protein [Bacteroidota bacterium]
MEQLVTDTLPYKGKIMRKSFTESTVLFLSIIKWVFLATIAGVIVGGSVTFFLKILTWSTGIGSAFPKFFWFLPASLFVSSLLVRYLAPDAEGHGTEKVIEAIHKRAGKIPVLVVPVKLVATIITLATGGSAGKEGPCAQIGAGLTSLFSDLLRFDDHDRKKMVICGISAGFASVFGTPIAGSIFGVEVLFVGAIMYDVLLPSFIAGIIAYQVSSSFGITYFHEPVSVVPVFSELFLIKVLLSGLFFGACSILLIEMLKWGEKIANRIHVWAPLKGIIGGTVLVGLTYIFSTHYLGLGLGSVESSLRGEATDWYAFLVKPVFTSITLSFGGSGGIVTPIFFVGSTAGATFAHLLNLNVATFAAIGLVSVLAGAANTPIAASIMAVELFGPAIAPYATLACVVSFLITGHRSVYPSQVLSISKSPSLQVELGREIEEIQTTFNPRKKGFIGRTLQLIKKIEETVNRIQGGPASSHETNGKSHEVDQK